MGEALGTEPAIEAGEDLHIHMVARGPHGSLIHAGMIYHPGQSVGVPAARVAEWKTKGWIRGPRLKAHITTPVQPPKSEPPPRGRRYVADISDELDGEEPIEDDPDADPIEVDNHDAADHLVGQEITTAGKAGRRGGRPARKSVDQPLT